MLNLALPEGSGRCSKPCHFLMLPPFKSVWTLQALNPSNRGIFELIMGSRIYPERNGSAILKPIINEHEGIYGQKEKQNR